MTLNITCKCKMCGGNNKMKEYNGAKFYDCEYCGTSQLVDDKYINEYTQEYNKQLARLEVERLHKENLERIKRFKEQIEKNKAEQEATNITLKTNYNYDQKEEIEKSFEDFIKHPVIVLLIAILIIGILITLGVESTTKKKNKKEVQSNKVITTKQETTEKPQTTKNYYQLAIEDYEVKNNITLKWFCGGDTAYCDNHITLATNTFIDNFAIAKAVNDVNYIYEYIKPASAWRGYYNKYNLYCINENQLEDLEIKIDDNFINKTTDLIKIKDNSLKSKDLEGCEFSLYNLKDVKVLLKVINGEMTEIYCVYKDIEFIC